MRGEDQRSLMFRLFAKGGKYQRLIEAGRRRLKQFGIKRILFYFRFNKLRRRIIRLEEARNMNVFAALGISRKLNGTMREEVRTRKQWDH